MTRHLIGLDLPSGVDGSRAEARAEAKEVWRVLGAAQFFLEPEIYRCVAAVGAVPDVGVAGPQVSVALTPYGVKICCVGKALLLGITYVEVFIGILNG